MLRKPILIALYQQGIPANLVGKPIKTVKGKSEVKWKQRSCFDGSVDVHHKTK